MRTTGPSDFQIIAENSDCWCLLIHHPLISWSLDPIVVLQEWLAERDTVDSDEVL